MKSVPRGEKFDLEERIWRVLWDFISITVSISSARETALSPISVGDPSVPAIIMAAGNIVVPAKKYPPSLL